jgi:hypothetical protein
VRSGSCRVSITCVCTQHASQNSRAQLIGPAVTQQHTSRCVLAPQAFVRYAAVNGAITVLRQGISHMLLDPGSGRCTGVTTSSGQRLQCEALVANALVLRWGLGWAGLGWAGLGWAGLGWAGLGWAGLGCAALRVMRGMRGMHVAY